MAKNKKRRHSRTVELKRQIEQEKLADAKDRAKKRMDPTARALLYGDLVFLAIVCLLDPKGPRNGVISAEVNGVCTIIGVVILVIALWFQFGKKRDGGGPKL